MNTRAAKKDRRSLLAFIQFSLLLAIELVVCFTPLGTLPAIGSLNATLSHIPVIVTAIILGTGAGAGMGFTFGMCSFIYWSFVAPGVFSFIYTPFYSVGDYKGDFRSLIICFVPRVLIGVVTALVYKALSKTRCPENVAAAVAGALGSLTNTVLVLGGVALFFGTEYMSLNESVGKPLLVILGLTVLTNGIPEALLGALAGGAIAVPVKKAVRRIKQ